MTVVSSAFEEFGVMFIDAKNRMVDSSFRGFCTNAIEIDMIVLLLFGMREIVWQTGNFSLGRATTNYELKTLYEQR